MIQQYIENPQLLQNLTPQQKTQVYQEIQKHLQLLQNQKVKAETELQIKQKEQQDLFKKLQEQTGLKTIQEIQNHIQNLQKEFDSELQNIISQIPQ